MRDERTDHTEHTEHTEHRGGQWPGPAPAAERKADEIRENLRGSGPETTATSTRQDNVPETAGAATRETHPGPVPAPEQASAARAGDTPGDKSAWLFEPAHTEEFRRRWDAIKASFVDDPRDAVRRADELTDELVRELTAVVESRRRELAGRWRDDVPAADDDSETERLRVALRSYRSMLDPILRV
jgi:hypothetical protein